jgi:uncharacterized protein
MNGETRIVEGRELAREVVEFRGHPMVRSSHPTTIEITTEDYLTESGDCIIGVGAAKGCAGLSSAVKERLKIGGSRVTLTVAAGGQSFVIRAQGDPRLTLTDPHDMVVRRSDYISGRTLAVRADASSRDLPREIVRLLKNPTVKGTLEIEVD